MPSTYSDDGDLEPDGLPSTGRQQSCAVCGAHPFWVHPIDPRKACFDVGGKEHTLPTFWVLCAGCERHLRAKEVDVLISLHSESACDEWDRAKAAQAVLSFVDAASQGRPLSS